MAWSRITTIPRFKTAWESVEWHTPPEIVELREALDAYEAGEEKPIWAFVEKMVGRRPDGFLRGVVEEWLLELGSGFPGYEFAYWLLPHHKRRLERETHKGRSARTPDKILFEQVRPDIKKFPSLDLALAALALERQTREDVLEEMIPGVGYVEKAKLKPGDNLAAKVANQIRREGLERPDQPGRVFAPGPDILSTHADELELFAFAQRELLERKVHEAGLSRQEAESWMFSVVLSSDKKAAEVLGRPASQVAQEKLRARRKLRRSV